MIAGKNLKESSYSLVIYQKKVHEFIILLPLISVKTAKIIQLINIGSIYAFCLTMPDEKRVINKKKKKKRKLLKYNKLPPKKCSDAFFHQHWTKYENDAPNENCL